MLKVRIRNFQSITDTSIEIDGFTVIVGKNNKGKSATIRAIDAALSNKLGNNFIKWGKTETQVNIQTGALDITWVKGDTASYKVNDKPYTSLKGAVPQPILDAGFRKLEIADEKLNPITAHQFDEIFLLNRSGPFITETISTLYDLNTLNSADTLCQRKLKSAKSNLKTRQGDLDTLTDKLNRFKGLSDVKIQFDLLKKLKDKSETLKKEISDLETFSIQLNGQIKLVGILKDIKNIQIPKIDNAQNLLTGYQWLVSATNQHTSLISTVKNLEPFKTIKIRDLSSTEKVITETQWVINTERVFKNLLQQINNLKNIEGIKIPDFKKSEALLVEVTNLLSLTTSLKNIASSYNKLSKGLIEINNLKTLPERIKAIEARVSDYAFITEVSNTHSTISQNVKNQDKDLSEAKLAFSKVQEEFNKYKNCPLCSSPLTAGHRHE